MMDIDSIDKKTEKATTLVGNLIKLLDKLLGGIAYLFKKYWILCICIGVGLFIYWAMTLPPVQQTNPDWVDYSDTTYSDTLNP